LLERTAEWLWLGQAYWAVAANHALIGECDQALEAARQAFAVGEAHGDVRVQTWAEWMSGWALGMKGEWDAGIAACQRALAGSRDAINMAAAQGFLGMVHLQKGDLGDAIAPLEAGTTRMVEIGYKFAVSLFAGWLGEALYLKGERQHAREVAIEGMTVGREGQSWSQAASNERTLGLVDQAEGALAAARSHLDEALRTFVAVEARFEAGRTHLHLAALAHEQGDPEAARTHLADARAVFVALGLPMHVERAQQLARRLGISLPFLPVS
jgi:tetratricopeptide (TPR) repeat protein